MSEFKFACPVCGQHITADSGNSGSQIECPTCFQKIVVPQAPVSAVQKFILSASKAGKRRTSKTEAVANAAGKPQGGRFSLAWIAAVVVLIIGSVGAAYVYKSRKPGTPSEGEKLASGPDVAAAPSNTIKSPFAVPTNFGWKLNITNAPLPAQPVAGRLHGLGFQLERSTFQNGTLALRQGKTWPPDLGVTIIFPAQRAEEFAGKTVEVWPERPAPIPRVVLRWKDETQAPKTQEYLGGYALKAAFGTQTNGRLPGLIYLALPDQEQSFLAGSFSAEIRTNAPAKKGGKKKVRPTQAITNEN